MADEKKSTGKSKALTQLEKDVYETFGMLPNEDRLTLLPRYKKGEGFIAPEMLYELAKAVQSPRTAMYSELGPEEAINMGLNVMGGSSVASAPRGALRMGIARPTLEPERRAALMEAERALPLNLPRAPAKSKQEIAAHAERVGRQMLGEHVRTGKPKDAQNLAGRSMKESQRLQKLQYELEPIKTLPPLTTVQPRIGDINVAVPGDASISDILLKSIEGEPIGSVQQGGSLYGLGKLDRDDPLFWASNEGPAQQMQDKITDLAALFDPERVLAQHLAMGRVANNFAQHFADASLRAIDYSKLSAKDMNTFDNVIAGGYTKKDKKTGEVKRITFPNWPGIADPEGALAAMKSDPEMRKWFLSRMKTRKLTKATNMPNALDIEWAITHPELRNMEVNLTGHSVGEMVPGAKLADDPDHETYLKGIRGTFLGQQENLTPFAISYPDAAQHVASTQRPQDFTGTIQKVFPHQRVDQQYLDEYYEYMRQLQKMLTGRKKGGAVEEVEGGLAPYGLRHSGEGVKGKGYFGLLPNKMDGVSTEISVEDETGEYPLIVPTLTAEELDRLLAGGEPTPEMLDKASSWAATRRKRGQSPFASPTEVRMPRPKAEGGGVYSPRPGLVFVGQEHGAPADVPQEIRDLANQVGAFYEGSGGDKLPDIRYRGSWDDAASKSVKGYPPEYLYTIFTNTDVNRQKDALVGDGTIFNNLLKNQQQVGYFKDRRFNRKDLSNFLRSMGPEFLRDSQNPATESNVEDFLKRGEQLMWESGDTPARQLADRANESRQRWLLNQPKGVFFMGSDHLQKLKELHSAGKKTPIKKADGGAITDLPDEVNPSNWREHLQNNVRADAQALLGVKDGGAINLDELIEKSLKKKDGGVINLDELIAWTMAKDEHRKMKEGGAVKMQGGGNPGEVAGDMFKPKPLSIPEPITSLVEALRRQFEKEKRSMSKPGAVQDVLMRGPVAAYAGAPADILGMGGELLDYAQKKIPALRKPASVMDTGPEKTPPMGYAPVFPLSPEGSYGTTAAQEMMGKAGLTTGEERPLFETGAMVGAPVAGYAGLKAGKALAPTAKEMLDVQLQRMMSPYQMNVIKSEGGNWVRGSTDKFLSGLRYDDEVDRLRIYTPEARAEEQARVDAYNNFIDKKLKRYMENQLGTPSDPVRIQADAWAETQKTLLAEKEKQISKVRSDIEKARRERNVDPEVLTRSQARLRQLQNEKDLIKNRKGLHFTPVTGDNSFAALEAASRRSQFGAPRERVAQSEIGKRWEDRADLSIYQQPYMDQPQIGIAKNYAEIKNAAEGTNIVDKAILDEVNKELEKMGGKYALENPEALAYRTSGGLDNLGFQHLADELDNALNPSMGLPEYLQLTPKTLDKMSVPQVVEHVDKINAWRASQKAEVDKARAANAATVVHKEYPEQGLKWVELKMPDFNSLPLEERKAMIERLREEAKQQGLSPESYIEKYPERMLEDALKYEGEILQHCVGGYCPDVVEGRSRIFSLRDEDGRPHATIEVEPEARIGFRQGEGPKTPDEDYALRNQYVAGVNDGSISNDMTFAEWWRSKNNIPEPVRPERISQIKGLQNKKPEAEFIPYIQDFVKSGDWSQVGDIHHTDLFKVTPGQKLPGFSKEIEPGYYTLEDFQKMAVENEMPQEILDSWMNKLQEKYRYGYAKGGDVKRRNGVTKADLEREYRMAFGGGVFNTDPDITDSGRIIPEHTI